MRLITIVFISMAVYLTMSCLFQNAKSGLTGVLLYHFFRIFEMSFERFFEIDKSGLPDFKNTPPPPSKLSSSIEEETVKRQA